jgi:hypothetical protein
VLCGLWQDMACDTFLKIVQKCKRKFVTQQVSTRFFFPMSICLYLIFLFLCLKSESLLGLVQSIHHDLQMLVILFSCCFTSLKFMHIISSIDLCQVLVFTFAHFLQVGENEPFVSELLSNLATTIADLEPHQIHTFYESVC